MNESLVQWTLLNNIQQLGSMLNFQIAKTIGQEITTEFGRIDFILEDNKNHYHVVELETVLNSNSKLDYCFNQILRYKNVDFQKTTEYSILFADETNTLNKDKIEEFGAKNNIGIKSYSLENIKHLYKSTIERLSLSVGLALPNPKNYTICYLRWINKVLKPFKDSGKSEIEFTEIFKPFENKNNSKTNFNCHIRIAVDFELLETNNDIFKLTTAGYEFIENMNPFIDNPIKVSSVDLTTQQKRLLLKILTNGNWENKVHKVNIYWFLRFIEITSGLWLPIKDDFERAKLDIANGLFNVTYKYRTMREFLTWCCNYCIELKLVERIKSSSTYDQIVLTPLGVEVNNIFSLDLTIKKSRMNLNFKYL